MRDVQHERLPRPSGAVAHHYGPRIHLLSQPWPMALLARLAAPETVQPEANRLLAAIYRWLLGHAASHLLGTREGRVPSRMAEAHPGAAYEGEIVDPDQRVVVVDVARAGMLPALVLYEELHGVVRPGALRQDHVVASRRAGPDGHVTGVEVVGEKIGGRVDGAVVLVPDPMGATGTSMEAVVRRYRELGPPARIAALHLVVTPEYLRRVARDMPELEVFAVRLDRGLSPADVLRAPPGRRWSEERGLDDHDYVVPGAGGMGEVLNNAWV